VTLALVFADESGGHAFRTRLNKQSKDREAGFLGQGG
jgi:hypothetical protein